MNATPKAKQAPLNLFDMFSDAEANVDASEALHVCAQQVHAPWFQITGAALRALALEIDLKLLILESGKSYGGIHALRDLFMKLAPDMQAMIREYAAPLLAKEAKFMNDLYAKHGATGMCAPDDFDEVLERSNNAFVKSRYLYEWRFEHQEGWCADSILNATRQVILKRHPEWANWRTSPRYQRATVLSG